MRTNAQVMCNKTATKLSKLFHYALGLPSFYCTREDCRNKIESHEVDDDRLQSVVLECFYSIYCTLTNNADEQRQTDGQTGVAKAKK